MQLESYRGDLAEFVKQNEEEFREVQSARRQQVQVLLPIKTQTEMDVAQLCFKWMDDCMSWVLALGGVTYRTPYGANEDLLSTVNCLI